MRPVAALVCLTLLALPVAANDTDALKTLVIDTGRAQDGVCRLAGRDATQQLVVTGAYGSGAVRDLTSSVQYQAAPAGIVAVAATGFVTPLKEGRATITAKAESATATVTIDVTHLLEDVPVNFPNQIVPLFTKFGCNSGGCHGKANGQNGFKLSLLGFEAADDYEYLVKEARGRRLMPAAPEQSLLLQKASGIVAHGGGKKIDKDSPYYQLLRRWIEQGAQYGKSSDPTITHIEVFPKDRILPRGSGQQLLVVAHLSDGTKQDVTRMTQFESNQTSIAEVSGNGLVGVKTLPGVAAIMARFQSHVDVFRATVPLNAPINEMPAARNFIDELVFKQLKHLGLPPSATCDDASFLRRVTIDIAGRLPTKAEAEHFTANKEANKYEALIDRLLASEDYSDYFANKWGAILRNRRRNANDDPKPTASFHDWIKESLAKNKPYDQFVRELLTATGEVTDVPQVVWYRELKEASAQMEDVSQLFLGQRIGCAKCHHHPFEKWSQDDYYGMTAFFSQVVVVDPPPAKSKGKNMPPEPAKPASVAHKSGVPQAKNLKTGLPLSPTGLGGKALMIGAEDDPRQHLADWMVRKDNPFFAKALANRYWKHFFSHGLVEPEDDLRATNPPTNPELLDALAKSFVDNDYDLKKLIRSICLSQTYRLSALPNEFNASDKQNYSRFLPKRLNAEVLLDAIDEVTQSKTVFKGAAPGTRAVQLPDNLFDSYFLSVFGRPDSASACECERSSDSSLAQSLHMFNSQELLAKVSGKRAKQLADDKRPAVEKIKDLYLVALSREPSKKELEALTAHLDKKKGNTQSAYEDILWALINTKEFIFNH